MSTESLEVLLAANTQQLEKGIKVLEQFKQVGTSAFSGLQQSIDRLEKTARTLNRTLRDQQGVKRAVDGQRKLADSTTRSSNSLQRQAQAVQQGAQAMQQKQKVAASAAKTTKQGITGTDAFRTSIQDLNKSTILALGPLAGVAARISAATALLKANGAAIGAVVISLTGYVVGLKNLIRVGREFETQQIRINAILEAVGERAVVTASQLEGLSRALARDTLAGIVEARDAAATLVTFGGQTAETFRQTLEAAQGLSRVVGGSLVDNTRRLGRLLEDPLRNFDSLRRVGLQFSAEERRRIQILRATGRVLQANELILAKFAPFTAAANAEAESLDGVLDTIGVNFRLFVENVTRAVDTTGRLGGAFAVVSSRIEDLLNSQDAANKVAQAFVATVESASRAIKFIADNFRIISGIVVGLISSLALGALIRLAVFLVRSLTPLGRIFKGIVASVRGVRGGLRDSGSAARGLLEIISNILSAAGTLAGIILGINVAFRKLGTSEQFFEAEAAAQNTKEILDSIARSGFDIDTSDLEKLQEDATEIKKRIEEIRKEGEKLPSVFGLFVNELVKVKDLWADIFKFANEFFLLSPLATIKDLSVTAAEFLGIKEAVSEAAGAVVRLNPIIRGANDTLSAFLGLQKQVSDARAEFVTRLEQETKALVDNTEEQKEAAKAAQEQQQALQALQTRATEMSRAFQTLAQSFLPNISRSIELKEALEIAQGQMQAFRDTPEIAKLVSEAIGIDAVGAVQALIVEIRKAIADLNKPVEVRFIQDLINQTEDARNALRGAFSGDTFQLDFGIAMREVAGLDDKELAAARNQLRELGFENLNTQEDIARAIVQQRQEISDVGDATKLVKDAEQDRLGIAGRILASFKEQRRVLSEAGALEQAEVFIQKEAFKEIAESFQKELNEALERDEPFRNIIARGQELNREFIENIIDRNDLELELTEEQVAKLEQIYAKFNQRVRNSQLESLQQLLSGISQITDRISQVFQIAADEGSGAAKAVAITGILVSAAQAIVAAKANANQAALTPPAAAALFAAEVASVGALVGAQIAQVRRAKDGGFITGPGTGTSDSIPALLSNGEFVMKASAVRKLGLPFMNAVNSGEPMNFARGGVVGAATNNFSTGVSVNIIDNRTGGEAVSVEEDVDEFGNARLQLVIEDTVKSSMERGRLDRTLNRNFGTRRQGRAVY